MPVPPLNATVTDRACVVVMLDVPGVTVTVGVSVETVTAEDVPEALL